MKKTAFIALLCAGLGFSAQTAFADPAQGQSLPHLAQSKPKGIYNPPKPKDGFRYPDCFCTDSQGKRVELGQTTCLQIGSSQVLAQCKMSLNNPSWKRIQEGCPSV